MSSQKEIDTKQDNWTLPRSQEVQASSATRESDEESQVDPGSSNQGDPFVAAGQSRVLSTWAHESEDLIDVIQPLPSPSPPAHRLSERRVCAVRTDSKSSSRDRQRSNSDTPGAYAVQTIRHNFGRNANSSPPIMTTRHSPTAPLSTDPSREITRSTIELTEQVSREVSGRIAELEEQVEESNGLAVADPVGSECSHIRLTLPHAEALDPKSDKPENESSNRRNMILCFLGLAVVVILVGVLLAVGLRNQQQKDTSVSIPVANPTPQPSTTTTLPLEQTILEILPDYTQRAILLDQGTPQARAYQWLVDDPRLPTYPEWRVKQRLALATLYFATDGDKWDNSTHWLNYEHHECSWYSSTIDDQVFEGQENQLYSAEYWMNDIKENGGHPCGRGFNATVNDTETGRYTRLYLVNNRLKGALPEELYWLTSLESASFTASSIGGTISSQVGMLSNLKSLNFVSLELEGTLPTEIGLLTKLTALILYTNSLRGSLPSEIGALQELQELYLEENSFTSTLPSEIGLLGKAYQMYLDTNGFFGALPTELGLLSSMKDFQIWQTAISGSIPTEIGLMTSLTKLDIAENALTGLVPKELSALQRVWKLALFDNLLTSTLPSELGLIEPLARLFLDHNALLGTIPRELWSPPNLTYVFLENNQFTGEIATEIGHCSLLTELNLSDNDLQGTIPDAIVNLTRTGQLVLLDVSRNPQLSGTLPEDLCVLPNQTVITYDCTEHLCGCECTCGATNDTNRTGG